MKGGVTEQDVGSPRLGKVGNVFSVLDAAATPVACDCHVVPKGSWEGICISPPLRCVVGALPCDLIQPELVFGRRIYIL